MNHSQSSENLFEPVPLNNGNQQGRNGQQPAQVIIVQQDGPSRSFLATLLISTLISIFVTPVAGLLALMCTRGKRAMAGALMGTAIGFLVYGILFFYIAASVYSSCKTICDPSTDTSASCDNSACDQSRNVLNAIAGGNLSIQC